MKSYFWLILILLLLLTGLFFSKRGYWSGRDKLNIAARTASGEIVVLSLNPSQKEILKINLPAETPVELPRNLGVMKIKNVWQLGLNEGLEGKLLAETITKNYRLPCFVWSDSQVLGFWQGGLKNIMAAAFRQSKTNLSPKDRLKIALFSLAVKDYQKNEMDINTLSSQNLLLLTADERLTVTSPKIKIRDLSGRYGLAAELGQVIEAMGGKIALVEEGKVEGVDCLVYSPLNQAKQLLLETFSCLDGGEKTSSGFEIEIVIGQALVERF